MTPVAIAIAIMPATGQVSSRVSLSGIATSSTSRSRNDGMTPSAAENTMRAETAPSRALYGRKSGKIRRRLAFRTAGSDGRGGGSSGANESKRRPGTGVSVPAGRRQASRGERRVVDTGRAIDRFLAHGGLSEATQRAYAGDLRSFASWLDRSRLALDDVD